MPKREAPVAWRITKAAQREPYPRKNIYFVGRGMEEVYNYCIWQAHVDGYITLAGKKARGVSVFIIDILTRRYLDAMLDPENFASFSEWCAAQQLPPPNPVVVAVRMMLHQLPKRSDLAGSLKEWQLSSREDRKLHNFCKTYIARHRDTTADPDEEAS